MVEPATCCSLTGEVSYETCLQLKVWIDSIEYWSIIVTTSAYNRIIMQSRYMW